MGKEKASDEELHVMAAIFRWCRQVLCNHRMEPDGFITGGEGMLVRRRCIRCRKLEYSHQSVKRRVM